MGVYAVAVAGRIGPGGVERECSGRVIRRGGEIQGGGNGTGRDDGPGIRVGRT